jgi:hypothetical protein
MNVKKTRPGLHHDVEHLSIRKAYEDTRTHLDIIADSEMDLHLQSQCINKVNRLPNSRFARCGPGRHATTVVSLLELAQASACACYNGCHYAQGNRWGVAPVLQNMQSFSSKELCKEPCFASIDG